MANDALETITSMNDRIAHIEDAIMDYREILIKLVKQSNQIVKFLKDVDIDADDIEYEIKSETVSLPIGKISVDIDKYEAIKKLIDKYIANNKDLKEFEEELKKYKDDITPGQVGES